jgi:hypothetical protein
MAGRNIPGRQSAAMMMTGKLRVERERAFAALRVHAKMCARCTRAMSITGDYCDTGWELAKARARAIWNWNNRDRITAETVQQEPLF